MHARARRAGARVCPRRRTQPLPWPPCTHLHTPRAAPQLLEQVLGYCSARELGALEATCSFFIKTGLTDKVARHFLREIPRAKGLKPDIRCAIARPERDPHPPPPHRWRSPYSQGQGLVLAPPPSNLLTPPPRRRGESYVTLLNFVNGQSNAAAQGTAVALGTYHTVALLSRNAGGAGPSCSSSAAAGGQGPPEYALYTMGRGEAPALLLGSCLPNLAQGARARCRRWEQGTARS